ncbi:hypothetical protein QZH41_019946 [Actinostola sp. cb2023]|nr:hypothetical protein QZH41_019946 [Actinostola sp. cb2023]
MILKALDVCDLKPDINQFPKGDLSVIGQRGVMLSGGQRARVGLARAVYSDADIFLLDDPLSAVDAKDVSFDVKPQEKVGIAGRTGAGKSSLVAALFRMPDPQGHVLIDGIDLGNLNIQAARRSMAVISQNPVLFCGTLQHNLDPFHHFTEEQIWTALIMVQMRDRVSKLDGLLEYSIGENGSGFSVGETQLLCLARALLQRCKILVLDEATANVDYKTDQLVQQVIREKFCNCTVLTIAHRLNTIMDYDRVLVLDGGHVVEYDSPAILAAKSDGVFAQLVQSQQGNGTSDIL